MDTITQGLLGAATAQLGFRQKIGRDATWVAAAAAIVPDLDIFIAPLLSLTGAELDDMARLRIHRGWSHSLFVAPLLALPIAALWWRARRGYARRLAGAGERAKPPPFWLLYLCVFVAVFTHPLLDWCTSYGTRLLEPLTDTRYAIDAAPIIDFIYTPLLLVTLLACWAARKIARGRAPRATLVIGWAGVLLSVGYLAAGRLLHDRAADRAAALVASKGEKVLRADAYPAIGTIFLWRAVVQTDQAWHAVRVHHFTERPPQQWRAARAARTAPNEWVRRARRLEEYQTYRWFTNDRIRVEYEAINGVHVVRFHDMRYSPRLDGIESLWPLVAEFDRKGKLVFVGRRMERRRREFARYAAAVWHDLWNP